MYACLLVGTITLHVRAANGTAHPTQPFRRLPMVHPRPSNHLPHISCLILYTLSTLKLFRNKQCHPPARQHESRRCTLTLVYNDGLPFMQSPLLSSQTSLCRGLFPRVQHGRGSARIRQYCRRRITRLSSTLHLKTITSKYCARVVRMMNIVSRFSMTHTRIRPFAGSRR